MGYIFYTPFSIFSVICRHIKREMSLRMSLGSSAGVVVCCQCHWESRPQEGGGIAQAWATWPEGALASNGTGMCQEHGVPEMVTPFAMAKLNMALAKLLVLAKLQNRQQQFCWVF